MAAPVARLGDDADVHGYLLQWAWHQNLPGPLLSIGDADGSGTKARSQLLFVVHALAQRYSMIHSLMIAA